MQANNRKIIKKQTPKLTNKSKQVSVYDFVTKYLNGNGNVLTKTQTQIFNIVFSF